MKADGHIHSPFCPHGTKDSFEEYIERALANGFTELSFTEHAPLPESFSDPTPDKDSGMRKEDVETYISTLQHVKKSYRSQIKINIGFEVDYIEGYETETEKFLTEFGPYIDDSILSVHFLKNAGNYYCLDFSAQEFERMISIFGSTDTIYKSYFQTVQKSIACDLGTYKPRRIGHITLVHKFQEKFPVNKKYNEDILLLLDEIKKQQLQLDYNGAGTVKPLCKETYPPDWVVQEAANRNIPLIYGSDAHAANGINQGFDALIKKELLCSPADPF
jgi:histidinol-phosphatase (PHP family)